MRRLEQRPPTYRGSARAGNSNCIVRQMLYNSQKLHVKINYNWAAVFTVSNQEFVTAAKNFALV
jgi:hypothetical protein